MCVFPCFERGSRPHSLAQARFSLCDVVAQLPFCNRLLDEIAALHTLVKAKMSDIQAMRVAYVEQLTHTHLYSPPPPWGRVRGMLLLGLVLLATSTTQCYVQAAHSGK